MCACFLSFLFPFFIYINRSGGVGSGPVKLIGENNLYFLSSKEPHFNQ